MICGSQVRPAQAGAGARRGPRRSVAGSRLPVAHSCRQLAALLAACLCVLALPLAAASGASEHGGSSSAAAAVGSHGAREASRGDVSAETLAHMRRKLITLDTAAGTRYFHQPLTNCLVTNGSNVSTSTVAFYPATATLTAADCAARCDAIPTCTGFKYPWFMNTQPAANTVPALTNGQTWNWCILLDSVEISTCTAVIRWDNSANYTQFRPQDIWEMYWRVSSRKWPAAATWSTLYNFLGNNETQTQTPSAWVLNPKPIISSPLVNLDTNASSRYFHQPLMNCSSFNASNVSSFFPATATLTAADCAARCDAIPTCVGFKYPWFMNTQPAANTVPALTFGQTWNWCIPLDWVNISSCAAEMRWDDQANNTQFRPQDIWEMYWLGSSRTWPAAGTWTTFYNYWGNASNVTLTPAPPPPSLPPSPPPPVKAEVDVALTAGLTVGLGAPLLIAASAAVTALLMRTVLRGAAAKSTSRRKPDGSRQNDVFVSYRRQDLQVADAVHDKLVLAGLRVFYDRGGGMAGRPFEVELFLAIKSAPVFAPVITLGDITHWAAHDVTKVDYTLAEFIVALHYARAGRIQLFFPLLVGEWQERPAAAGGGERDYLMSNPDFKKARDALPRIIPTATIAVVNAMFAAAGKGETLDAVIAGSTVRDIIVGSGSTPRMHIAKEASLSSGDVEGGQVKPVGGSLRGVLEMDSAMLYGPDEQAGLVLRHRYAESILTALYGKEEKK